MKELYVAGEIGAGDGAIKKAVSQARCMKIRNPTSKGLPRLFTLPILYKLANPITSIQQKSLNQFNIYHAK